MKKTTYTIAEAKKINENIMIIEKLQRKIHHLKVTWDDLFYAEKHDPEMVEVEKAEIIRIEKTVEHLALQLNGDDLNFSDNHSVRLLEGEGGSGYIEIIHKN